MAFEDVLAPPADGPRRRRRMTLGLAVAVHGALLGTALVHSVWRVDEVAPPPLVVPRVWIPAPGPQVAPAPGGGGPIVEVRPRPRPTRPPRVQPAAVAAPVATDTTAGAPPSAGSGTGTGHGDGHGSGTGPGGGGGGGDEPPPPRLVPPHVASQRCLRCPAPHLPPASRRPGPARALLAKICADERGHVASVKVLQGIDPEADAEVIRVLAGWRYQPVAIDGRPVPFCAATRFLFSAE